MLWHSPHIDASATGQNRYLADFQLEEVSSSPPSITAAQWELISDLFGESGHSPGTVAWLQRLIREQRLVDSFRSMYPTTFGTRACSVWLLQHLLHLLCLVC